MSTVAEPSAGTAEFKQLHGTDVPTGTARSATAAPLPSDGGNGVMHMGMEKATESERTLPVSPVLSMHSQWERGDDGTGENGDRQVPLLEGRSSMKDRAGACCTTRMGMLYAIRMEHLVLKK